eukprot:1369901-Amorphochlora_amoeboformis.AAC.1
MGLGLRLGLGLGIGLGLGLELKVRVKVYAKIERMRTGVRWLRRALGIRVRFAISFKWKPTSESEVSVRARG